MLHHFNSTKAWRTHLCCSSLAKELVPTELRVHIVRRTLVPTSTAVSALLTCIYIVLKFIIFLKAATIQNKLVTQFHLSAQQKCLIHLEDP